MEKLAERKRSKNCKLSAEKDIGAENYVRRANFLEKLINCAINASRHPTFSLTPRNCLEECDDDCKGNEEGFRDECEMTDVARSLDISISAEKLLFDAHSFSFSAFIASQLRGASIMFVLWAFELGAKMCSTVVPAQKSDCPLRYSTLCHQFTIHMASLFWSLCL